ncbi:MAG: ribonuclease J [Acidimicrobiales bacterium]|nr:MAG: ribonuclease J [Acidimicrobiales bacterium]
MSPEVALTFLGGLGEIGRNCAVLEFDGRIVVLDCGLMFPDLDMLGVDLVLPDFTYLIERADDIEAVVATHGHEDHIGGIGFLLSEVSDRRGGRPISVYGSRLTLAFMKSRLEESGVADMVRPVVVRDGERLSVGPFEAEFIPVAHSVPEGFAVAFHTPQGVILHSGDFKIDVTPVDGRITDLARIGRLADEGVRLLLADSTNATEEGYSRSERSVGAVLRRRFFAAQGRRIIAACFASHIHRVQQIVDAAVETGRRVAFLGMSMQRTVSISSELGLLRVPGQAVVPIETVEDLSPGETCVICTGSQGEPMSALALMASGESRWIRVGPQDTVIISSHPIPGNEFPVGKVIDGLIRAGAEVVDTVVDRVHATGHAKADELRLFHSLVRPEWFIPVHGEYRHLARHAELVREVSPSTSVLVCTDGDRVVLGDEGIRPDGRVPAGYLYVDGTVGDLGGSVLRDRRVLAEEGVVVVVVTVDVEAGTVLAGPQVITKGWVHAEEAEDLLDEAAAAVAQEVKDVLAGGASDIETIQRHVRRATGRFVWERTRRRPMIVPVVTEV